MVFTLPDFWRQKVWRNLLFGLATTTTNNTTHNNNTTTNSAKKTGRVTSQQHQPGYQPATPALVNQPAPISRNPKRPPDYYPIQRFLISPQKWFSLCQIFGKKKCGEIYFYLDLPCHRHPRSVPDHHQTKEEKAAVSHRGWQLDVRMASDTTASMRVT
jgi:hypothetical protein